MRAKFVIAAFFAALLVVVPFAVAQDGEDPGITGLALELALEPPPLHKLLAEKAASIVTLRCVLNVQITAMGQTQEEERNLEVAGVLVNKTGLVLTANTHFEGGMPPAAVQGVCRRAPTSTERRLTPGRSRNQWTGSRPAGRLDVAVVREACDTIRGLSPWMAH